MCTTWVLVLKNIWPTQRVILPKPNIRLSLIIYASIVNTNKNWCATRLGTVCDSLRCGVRLVKTRCGTPSGRREFR